MNVETPGVSPERGNSWLTRHNLPLIEQGSPLGSLSHSCFPQFVGNGSKLLVPFRVLFEEDLAPDCGSAANACCNPAIWWTFLQAPEIRASWPLFNVLMSHLRTFWKCRFGFSESEVGSETLRLSQVPRWCLCCCSAGHTWSSRSWETWGQGWGTGGRGREATPVWKPLLCAKSSGISNPVWSLQCEGNSLPSDLTSFMGLRRTVALPTCSSFYLLAQSGHSKLLTC